jgi:D-alanine-D-alanine ligase-like ATP-grasp enzyme
MIYKSYKSHSCFKEQSLSKKLKVGVIFGGRSGEHEVSLRSAESVINAIDKTKVLDKFLSSILGGDISRATRETLLKQLDQQVAVSLPAPRVQTEPAGEMQLQMDGPGAAARQTRREATIADPVTKVVGLILGTPEFQRQ